ncbi:MAG: hypothetical protein AB4290_21560 [Spirulina sp.]
MNLLSSLSTLNLVANCRENWHLAARERALANDFAIRPADAQAIARMGGEVSGEIGESSILLNDTSNDTIVSNRADCSKTLDRFFYLPSRQESIPPILSEIASQIKNYRHNSEHNSESERLFVGLNPQQPSGRYGPRPKVPK